jgi:hypothetical protein
MGLEVMWGRQQAQLRGILRNLLIWEQLTKDLEGLEAVRDRKKVGYIHALLTRVGNVLSSRRKKVLF